MRYKVLSKLIKKEKRFEIDTEGFKTQMSEMSLWRLIQEIISNSFDEKSVSKIICHVGNFKTGKGKPMISVSVFDNGKGFIDYKDIFTLYKDSYKRINPEQRGRFNLGEKQFFAVAKNGSVKTTKWLIKFYDDTREIEEMEEPFEGTQIDAEFEVPEKETVDTIVDKLHDLVVPSNKTLTINSRNVEQKKIVTSFKCVLPTSIASGKLSKLTTVKRETQVILYEKSEDEPALVYEIGVPIQNLQDSMKWNIDIQQKVPQVTSRNVISDKYLAVLYSEIAKNTLDLITEADAGSSWVSDALKKSDAKTSNALLTKIYGTDKVMIESTTDYRANEKALEQDFILIKGATLDPDVRTNLIKNTGVITYAGKVFETTVGDSEPVEPNQDMKRFAEIVKRIAKDVCHRTINVSFFKMKDTDTSAQMGNGVMSFNTSKISKASFREFPSQIIDLIIHELGHLDDDSECSKQYAHLNMGYLNSITKIGGKMTKKGINHWVN